MDHEEQGRGFPGWLLRYLYRPLVGMTVRRFERELKLWEEEKASRAPTVSFHAREDSAALCSAILSQSLETLENRVHSAKQEMH